MPTTKPAPTHEEFVFRVGAPSLSYSFSIEHDRPRWEDEPFVQRHSLEFITECISPARFAGREGKGMVLPEPGMADLKRMPKDSHMRRWIGYVRATKTVCETVIWLPPETVWHVGQAMSSGLARSLLTNGLIEGRGMTRLTHASFYGEEFDADDYVG